MFGLNGRQTFFLIVLLIVVLYGIQYGPPYLSALQFNDFIRQEVKFAVASRKTTEVVRRDIVEKAKELGIDIAPKDIHITRRGPAFQLDLEYRFPINMRIYQTELVFHASETGEVFENASN